MSRDVAIRPYQPGDEGGILALFNEVFAEGNLRFRPRTREHWNWQFRDNALGHHTYVAVAAAATAGIATTGDRIVGTYTAIPGFWLEDGVPFVGSQAVDTCVAKEHRAVLKREGVFLSLARAFFDRYGQPDADRIVYGFPNPIAFRVGTRQLDYRPVHSPVVALVRDFDQAWIDYLPGMGGAEVDVVEESAVPPEADALFAAMAAPLRLVSRRDAAWLKWRYLDCPTFRYRLLAARDRGGALRGLLAMRTGWNDEPLAPLVDWVVRGDDRPAIAGLARAAALLAREDGKARLETWVPPWSPHWRSLSEIGFAPDPSRFHLCIRVFGPAFDEAWARDHWFFTMGDSDVY